MKTPLQLKKAKRWAVFSAILLAGWSCISHAEEDSDVRPPVTQNDLLILRRADQILSSEAVWNRADDRVYHPEAKTLSLYTALEKATLEVGGKFAHREAVMQETRFAIEELAPGKDYHHRLMDYNNEPSRTFADIKRVIALTEEHVAKRLENDNKTSNPTPVLQASPSP